MGDVLVCKMKGFCSWPCIVIGIDHNLINVEFFGDHTTHKAAIHNFFKFSESLDELIHNLKTKKNPLFKKSVQEAELALGIPTEMSIMTKLL